MAALLIFVGIALVLMSVVHVAVGIRLFTADRGAARRPAGEAWYGPPPRSDAGRHSTLVGCFHALAVNWSAVGAVLIAVALWPVDTLVPVLLAIVAFWSAGNLFCALRWVAWNRVAQLVFAAVGLTAIAALLLR